MILNRKRNGKQKRRPREYLQDSHPEIRDKLVIRSYPAVNDIKLNYDNGVLQILTFFLDS